MHNDTSTQQGKTSLPTTRLSGICPVPGDKSVSHRALIFATLSVGTCTLTNLSNGHDVLRTRAAMQSLGATLTDLNTNAISVSGLGIGGLQEPENVIDMGNSGTGARLIAGLLATHDLVAVLTGDASLRSRPMERIMTPLQHFGAQFSCRAGGLLPLTIRGSKYAPPISYRLPVASAQIKSAVLLAALNVAGISEVIEPTATRAHTEKMLRLFGADVSCTTKNNGETSIKLVGQPELIAQDIEVPADPSAAAFPIVSALIVPDSEVTVPDVMIDPYRCAFLSVLRRMGANITVTNIRDVAGEQIADITAKSSELHGIDIEAEEAPGLIDEYPILAVAAACARGRTSMKGLAELRVKECDRLAAIRDGLVANGVAVESGEDWLEISGCGTARIPGGARVITHFDHRIAMAFLVMGCGANEAIEIDDISAVTTSFPSFCDVMEQLGAEFGTCNQNKND